MLTSLLLLTAQAAVPPSTIVAKADKMHCVLEYQANSRIPSRICMPKSEWERIAKQNQDDFSASRNWRASGRSGTIVDSAEGTISGYDVPGATTPGGLRTTSPR